MAEEKKITDEIISDEELENVAGGIGTASELIGAIARTAEKSGGVNKNSGVEENNEISIPSRVYGKFFCVS